MPAKNTDGMEGGNELSTVDQVTSTQNRIRQQNRNNVNWLRKQSKNPKHLPAAAYLKDLRMHR